MANETEVGSLAINLKMKLEGLEKSAEVAKKKLQEIEQQNEQLQKSNKNLDASFIAMSAGIVASLMKIKSAIDSGVDAYKEYESANKGLESIVKGQGLNFNSAQSFIEDYISDGLIPLTDATLAYKNLASRGYSEEQIKKTMIALKDAAAFGRQSTYEYGQAIATATEGLKNENSVLVDNAGVTKNVAKMWEDYAKSKGKTTKNLTQEEKIQAEVNGILEESKNQVGDAIKYADTYAGKQAQLNASTIELQKTYGETMIPTMTKLTELQGNIIQGTTEFVKNNKSLTSGLTAFVVTLGTVTFALTALKKANEVYKASTAIATLATEGFSAALKANPLFMIATTIATVVSAISTYSSAVQQHEELQEKLNETSNRYNQILQGTLEYTNENIAKLEEDKKAIEDRIGLTEKTYELEKKITELNNKGLANWSNEDISTYSELSKELEKTKEKLFNLVKENGAYASSLDELKEKLTNYSGELEKANSVGKIKDLIDANSIKNLKKEASQAVETAKSYQELFKIYQQGQTETKEYQNAVKELEKKFPEAVSANGIMAQDMKTLIDSMASDSQIAWTNAQNTIQDRINKIESAIANCQPEIDVNGTYAKSLAEKIGIPTNEVIGTLQTALDLFNMLLDKGSNEVGGVKVASTYTPKSYSSGRSGSSKTYSNKALDNYKELIEYKKSLDKISLQEEIEMYKKALNSYAKTTKEKRELTVKIHELEKELDQETLDNFIAKLEHRKALNKISLDNELKQYQYAYKNLAKTREERWQLEEKIYDLQQEIREKDTDKLKQNLDEQVRAIENSMEQKEKIEGAAYTTVNREKDYNQLIKVHQKYLNKILASEKISLEKKKEIYQEELDTIKSYEEQKRNLRVSSIDNTVTQLKNAIVKQLQEMQDADKKAIEDNIALVEKWKNTRINAINEEYNARIEAIQKELDLLDKSEQEKTRTEEDAEYERKKNRLQELIDYEHDMTTRANYQKELNKLIEDYQKTLDKRTLDDKKKSLKEQQELLKEQQSTAIETVNKETDALKESYNTQLDNINDYYKKQQDMAQETAEKMLLNVNQTQSQIIKLLKKYGDQYEITGQSLGEKLAQGINEGITNKIENIIKKVQQKIDTAIENKIASWISSVDNTTKAGKTSSSKNVVVTQNNYIQQVQETPSETYRKLKNIEQKLADQLAGA